MKGRVFHISLIIFAVIFCLQTIHNTTNFVLDEIRVDNIGKINAIIHHEVDVPIMIWGASTAFVNFDDSEISLRTGKDCFNMGIDGTNIDQYNGLLNEFLDYTLNCQYLVIVLDIHSSLDTRDKFYNLHNWIHHFDNDNIYNNMSDIDSYFSFKTRYVPFHIITSYDKHALSYVKKYWFNKDVKYFPKTGALIHDSTKTYNGQSYRKFNVNLETRAINKVNQAIGLCKSKGITPIIVVSPCYTNGLAQIKNRKEFQNQIKSFESEGALIFDYLKTSFSDDSTTFKDNTHLNAKGVKMLSEYFSNDILKLDSIYYETK